MDTIDPICLEGNDSDEMEELRVIVGKKLKSLNYDEKVELVLRLLAASGSLSTCSELAERLESTIYEYI